MTRRPRRGVSLVEVMVGMAMLTIAVLGLAAAASTALRQTTRARDDSQYWADVQRIGDSLIMRGFGNTTSNSTSVNRRPIKWVVMSGPTAPESIYVIAWRTGYQVTRGTGNAKPYKTVIDTAVLYISRNVPGS